MDFIYSKAPIKEAIIDISIIEMDINLEDLEDEILKSLPKDFLDVKKILNFGGQINIKSRKTPELITSEEVLIGYMFSRENIKVQFRKNGFTINFLSPYTNWKEFFDISKIFWKKYQEIFKGIKIDNISLRYINEIKIPLPIKNFEDYIVNIPPIPKCLPQNYSHFFMQIEVPCENEFVAVITETTLKQKEKYILPFILDINIQKEIKGKIDFEEDFNYMRRLKNLIFEDFITDNLRKLFTNENRI
ncbi:TIGR04255 family protein [Epilithonimonas xixisoli]|uniref:Uncharacterized protein (TIGR04255 family) n=1 Tax=Epilithonimonas xixisoli TaxID=1476462 RepID=A0A4R8I684_9FLAO|nr:TIGR04255 family protein [Epilithonimonas xixisoli]TDX84412.1 uncharacterized protein (TIGR04255 family) [Epilithonimonas xixisoli]